MKSRYYYLSEPNIGKQEIDLVKNSLDLNWLSSNGKNKNLFKHKIKKKLKAKYISLVNSGTSALHMAFNCLNIKKSDVILTQTFTFVASVNPILMQE